MRKIKHGDGTLSSQRGMPADLDATFRDARRYRALRILAIMPEATQQMACDLLDAESPLPVASEAEFDRRIDHLLKIVGL